jgi:hypothetical protein
MSLKTKNLRRHNIAVIQHIALEHLNGAKLTHLSEKFNVPYSTLKWFKKHGFGVDNFNEVERKFTTYYALINDSAQPITKIAKKYEIWESFRRLGF